MVPVSGSYATRRRLNKLLDALKTPDSPAFVVLNDDMPDRVHVKEAATMDQLILQWMEKVWPEKVWIFLLPAIVLD